MNLAVTQRRAKLIEEVETLCGLDLADEDIVAAGKAWLESKDDPAKSRETGDKLVARSKPSPSGPDRHALRGAVAGQRQEVRLPRLHRSPRHAGAQGSAGQEVHVDLRRRRLGLRHRLRRCGPRPRLR